jgi:hypothetical protein
MYKVLHYHTEIIQSAICNATIHTTMTSEEKYMISIILHGLPINNQHAEIERMPRHMYSNATYMFPYHYHTEIIQFAICNATIYIHDNDT